MQTKEITKVLNKKELNNTTMSLGFRRLTVLPVRVRRAFDRSLMLKIKSADIFDLSREFFENMTEAEYINFLKLA